MVVGVSFEILPFLGFSQVFLHVLCLVMYLSFLFGPLSFFLRRQFENKCRDPKNTLTVTDIGVKLSSLPYSLMYSNAQSCPR